MCVCVYNLVDIFSFYLLSLIPSIANFPLIILQDNPKLQLISYLLILLPSILYIPLYIFHNISDNISEGKCQKKKGHL